MTIPAKPAALLPLAKLPRTPASDLKKLGWRGMMNALRSKGKIVVTNHDEPEAVIIPVAEYDASHAARRAVGGPDRIGTCGTEAKL